MNRDNVQKAINIMRRAGKVNMLYWQCEGGVCTHNAVTNEEDLHACGNSACFAGWVAVSPEFQADGGSVTKRGSPRFNDCQWEGAIAEWLEIPRPLASQLTLPPDDLWRPGFYPVPWRQVRAEHVIAKLEELLAS